MPGEDGTVTSPPGWPPGLSGVRLCLTFGGDGAWCQPSRIRWRSRVNPARPYICRLIIFVLVFTPSVRPLWNGRVTAAPRPSAVAFVTTEHFTLQGARSAAITESTSRATIFIGSVSAGLVALGLIATATRIGTAFYAFGLILLSTLSGLAQRVLACLPDDRRNDRNGHCGPDWLCRGPARHHHRGHSAVAGFVTGGVVGAAVLAALMWFQYSAWAQAHQQRLFESEQERPDAG
jgi:hypothetical protein